MHDVKRILFYSRLFSMWGLENVPPTILRLTSHKAFECTGISRQHRCGGFINSDESDLSSNASNMTLLDAKGWTCNLLIAKLRSGIQVRK